MDFFELVSAGKIKKQIEGNYKKEGKKAVDRVERGWEYRKKQVQEEEGEI